MISDRFEPVVYKAKKTLAPFTISPEMKMCLQGLEDTQKWAKRQGSHLMIRQGLQFDLVFMGDEKMRYEVVANNGGNVWDILPCRTRENARDGKRATELMEFGYGLGVRWAVVKIWDRKNRRFVW